MTRPQSHRIGSVSRVEHDNDRETHGLMAGSASQSTDTTANCKKKEQKQESFELGHMALMYVSLERFGSREGRPDFVEIT